ncbi:hypothetical protein CEUSTIGMA_g3619.t1 [Chlamydomonas eustigma]|uniref:guanylate cyclase n=1 Tax=Chlamydomonas eustigma TaxID=1157962 RepID=A0A250WZG4_9CHLO|nr:hypothetical protein CEUSTIGMA_g3619.t1 [Chlamydomonas eustigma]|eukprot:GAX76175.1 hypothetical protein CEUSTIGMA_g3619.t1 [Chlamydomonas eustigma]
MLTGSWSSDAALSMMGATCELANITYYDAGRAFGHYFVKDAITMGYGTLISLIGRTFVDFLCGLNNLHLHLSLDMPAFVPPDFRVEKVTSSSIELHYRSTRPCLGSWVVGICEEIASSVYCMEISFELLKGRDDGSCDHEVWCISFPDQSQTTSMGRLTRLTQEQPQIQYSPSADLFYTLFPFHMVIDRHMTLVQVGSGILRSISNIKPGSAVSDLFKISVPFCSWDFAELSSLGASCVCLLRMTTSTGLELKGAFHHTYLMNGSEALLFTGSPRIKDLDELKHHQMFLSDIPPHDMSSDFVVVAEQRQVEADLTKQLESDVSDMVVAQRETEKALAALAEEKHRVEALLHRQYELIACISMVMDVGKSAGNGHMASELLESVRLQIKNTTMEERPSRKIEQLDMIGSGSYGNVFRGTWRGQEVAIKSMVLPSNISGAERSQRMAIMEAAISNSLSHPNIVKTLHYSLKPVMQSSLSRMISVEHEVEEQIRGTTDMRGGLGSFRAKDSFYEPGNRIGTGMSGEDRHTSSERLNKLGCSKNDSHASPLLSSPVQRARVPARWQDSLMAKSDGSSSGTASRKAVEAAGCPYDQRPASCGTIRRAHESISSRLSVKRELLETARNGHIKTPGIVGCNNDTPVVTALQVQIVLEYCDCGNLRNALTQGCFLIQDKSHRNYSVSRAPDYAAVLDTALDIASGMLHLHNSNVVHSDLKAQNILLQTNLSEARGVTAKVSDFGLSMRITAADTHVSKAFQGTLTHMAPEVLVKGIQSTASDVYAFGITLWELYTSRIAFEGVPSSLLGHQIVNEDLRPEFPTDCPIAYVKLAHTCWDKAAEKRPRFKEILASLQQMRLADPRTAKTLKFGIQKGAHHRWDSQEQSGVDMHMPATPASGTFVAGSGVLFLGPADSDGSYAL